MTWPSYTYEEALSGKGAKTIGEDLWDIDLVCVEKMTMAQAMFGTTASTSYTTVASTRIRWPEFLETNDKLWLRVSLKNQTAGIQASAVLRDNATSNVGNSQSVTGTTPAWKDLDLPMAAGWGGTIRTLELRLVTAGGGTAEVNSTILAIGNLWFTDEQ